MIPYLSLPDQRFKTSFLIALREYHAEHLPNYEQLSEEWLEEHFNDYVNTLKLEAEGAYLPPGFVPHTVFWLTDGDEYLGRLDIRHHLNDRSGWLKRVGGHIGYDIRPTQRGKGYGKLILQLGLEKARELGLENVLMTCDVTNGPSNKIIQANGGQLQDTVSTEPHNPAKNRYLLKL